MLHLAADGNHLTAQLDPGDERQRRSHLVLAAREEHVGEVQRDGGRAHEHLGGGDLGDGQVDEREHLARLAVAGDLPGAHHRTPPWATAERSCATAMLERNMSVICRATTPLASGPAGLYHWER